MASRDDMVISPSIEEERAATPTRAREGRHVPDARRRKGRLLRRLAMARAAKRRVAKRAAGRGGAGLAGRAAVGGGAAAAAAIVVAIVVAARLISGRSFGGMGAKIEETVLGDAALRAIARQQASRELMASPYIMRVAARTGSSNTQIRRLHDMLTEQNYRAAKGAASFMRDEHYDVDSKADLLLLGIQEKVEQAIRVLGINHAVSVAGGMVDTVQESVRGWFTAGERKK